jgi:hypothetical protein
VTVPAPNPTEEIEMMYGLIALLGLALFLALLPISGGVLWAPLPLGVFLFALAGVFAAAEDRTVGQRGGVVEDARRWRNGS